MEKTINVILLIVLTLIFDSYGQGDSKPGKSHKNTTNTNLLAGAWKLIDYADFDSVAGHWTHPYGDHPRGYFTYTKGGAIPW